MELDIRGTPLWQMQEYLRRMGLEEGAGGAFLGPGVTVTMDESEYEVLRSTVPRIILRVTGEPATVEQLAARLRLWTLRLGG